MFVFRRLIRVYYLKRGRIVSASRASFPLPLSLAPEVPHAVGLPGPPPGHRDGDRRFFRPKSRRPNGHVFQPQVHRTPVLVFRRGVLPGHVERRDRRRLRQAGLPTRNRARGPEADVAGAVTPEARRPGKWAAAAGALACKAARRLQRTRPFFRALSGQRNTWLVADGVPGNRE